tara:strand:- start:3613 stop:4533 length:921 start_codon:yes stop_codon:yes gene_type:complete
MYKNVFIFVLSLFLSLNAMASNTGIVASVKPLHSLVSAVVGDTDKVSLLISGNVSPHNFALKPSHAKMLNNTAVFFHIDAGQFESAIRKTIFGLPSDVRVFKVAKFKNLNLLPLREGVNWEEDGHDHHGHDHGHGSEDMHFWLDPNNGIEIVKGITRELSKMYPENINTYKKNAKEVIKKIKLTDDVIKTKLESIKEKKFIVFHDAYQYFEKAYGLSAIGSILVDPEQPPSPNRLIKIRSKIKTLNAHCVFKEPQFRAKIINTVIEDTNVKVGTLDPLGSNLEAGPNMYVNLLENISNNLVDCLGK